MNKLEIKAQIEAYDDVFNWCQHTDDLAIIMELCQDEIEQLKKRLETLKQLGH